MSERDEIITRLFSWVSIINASYNPIIAIDHEGVVRVYNKAASRVFGINVREALGSPIEQIAPQVGLRQIVQTGEAMTGLRYSFNRRTFVLNLTPIIRKDYMIGAVAIFQDVTEIESIADELNRVKELKGTLETILEAAYDGIIVVNSDGIITMVNKAWYEFFGFKEEDLLGKHVADVVENTRLHIVLKTGKPEVGELQRTNNHDFIATRIPIIKDGRVVGAIGKIMFKNIRELNALAGKVNSLKNELAYYKDELQKFRGARYSLDSLTGHSHSIQMLKETARRVARSASTVLLRGESGTGKELLAHALHLESDRRNGPFIQVNCGSLSSEALEIELFGSSDQPNGLDLPGKIRLAHQGTLLLDEIGDMPLPLQAKLLRVLQGEPPVVEDGEGLIPADVRLVVATNRNLEDLIKKGLFREDLYYRLNVVSLFIPPLRDRREDIPGLVNAFIQKFNKDFGMGVQGLTMEAMSILHSYHWPGNVRELANVIERAYNLLEGDTIDVGHLPMYLQKFAQSEEVLPQQQNLQSLLEQTEKAAILRALLTTNGNKVQAAQLLGISRAGLYQKLLKYNIGE